MKYSWLYRFRNLCVFLTSTRECGVHTVDWVKTASLGHIPDMTKLPKVAKIFQRFEECCRVFSTLPITDPPTCQVLTKSCFAFSCSGWVGGSPALAIAQIFCIFCTPPSIFGPRLRVGLSEPFNICLPPRLNSRNLQFLIFLKEELV